MTVQHESHRRDLPPGLARWHQPAWGVGIIGAAICVLLLVLPASRTQMYPAYLVGYIYWVGIALGGAAIAMLHHLTSGSWGLLVRRPLEAAALTIIPLAVLFVPILFGLDVLYPWARPGAQLEHAIAAKAAYLNGTAFTLRAAGYFALWIIIALALNGLSRGQDKTTDRTRSTWLQRISAPGLGLVFLTASFAAIDWLMSLEPDWYSSIYGAMLITAWGLATFCAMILVAGASRDTPPMSQFAKPARFQDLGNLTLAFVMLWAYTSFMQYLIIWSGNLREEIPWYLRRTRGGWELFVAALILFHFFAPFMMLLLRGVKRKARSLMMLAALVLVLHLVDTTWLVLPAQVRDPRSAAIGVPILQLALVLLATVSIGGLWIGCFLSFLRAAPIVPVNDPAIDRASHDDHHDDDGDDESLDSEHAGAATRIG